ncbi:predicted protein [Lichtheimia corymbifera JMRC:FSU:9682]|uniref:Uncharacterized protein n=1 Tax=Lichtheimia corymbifera JMRC:FSU:9682 TaxID=1263082 RepID=A0A068RRP8_9FUNG|nr:predicted protein [Lichtheimia corymbifera JMRC:FSU:9682]
MPSIQASTSMEQVRLHHWALNVPVDTKRRAGIATTKRQQRYRHGNHAHSSALGHAHSLATPIQNHINTSQPT